MRRVTLFLLTLALLANLHTPTRAQSDTPPLRLGQGTITTSAWSPDGSLIAVGTTGGLWLYDPTLTLLDHPAADPLPYVAGLAWSADSRVLAFATPTQTMLYDAVQGRTLTTGLPAARTLDWHGSALAIGSRDGLLVWDSATRQRIYSDSDVYPYSLAWSATGVLAVAEFVDKFSATVTLYDGTTWIVQESQNQTMGQVKRMDWDATGQRLALAFEISGLVAVWNVADGTFTTTNGLPYALYLYALAWTPDNRWIAAGGHDESVWLIDPQTLHIETLDIGHCPPVIGVAWSADSQRLLTASQQRLILWDMTTQRVVAQQDHFALPITRLDWGNMGLVVGTGSRVMVWLAADTVPIILNKECERLTWQAVVTTPSGAVLAFADYGPTYAFLTRDDATPQQWPSALWTGVSYRNGRLYGGDDIGIVQVWTEDGARLATYSPPEPSNLLAVAPDESRFVSYTADSMFVWEPSGTIQYRHTTRINLADWQPAGTYLAIAEGRTLSILDTSDFSTKVVREGQITAMRWAPTGNRLALVLNHQTVAVWDVEADTWLELSEDMPAHIGDVAWQPDGTHLAVGGADGIVRVVLLPE